MWRPFSPIKIALKAHKVFRLYPIPVCAGFLAFLTTVLVRRIAIAHRDGADLVEPLVEFFWISVFTVPLAYFFFRFFLWNVLRMWGYSAEELKSDD